MLATAMSQRSEHDPHGTMFITVFVAYSGGLAAAASDDAERHCVMVEYTDLIGTSLCRARQWAAYARGFHLWEVGRPTSVGVQVLAESGHPEYNLSDALWDHDTFGDFAVGLPNVRGSTHRVKLTVDASHLLTSGGWMLAAANGGFAGVDGVDALALTELKTLDSYALDACTEKDTESKEDAIGGLGHVPENSLVHCHEKIPEDVERSSNFVDHK